MDRLVVIDGGRTVEQGSHEELLQARALYASLWAHQSGGFLGDEVQGNAVA
jgi:ATP-binding cassette subfamily B multidrug efflux pump